MALTLRVRYGQVIGRNHLLHGVNCQDGIALVETRNYFAAILCDGCSEGARSEIGARVTAEFAAAYIGRLLAQGAPVQIIPSLLYPAIIQFLRNFVLLVKPVDAPQFVLDALLFTVLGTAVRAEQAILFAAGDGTLVIDNQVFQRDENNAPRYIAYHLLNASLRGNQALPETFAIYEAPPTWERLALATDGFEVNLLPHVWGMQHSHGLQRRMDDWWANEGRFHDDATLLTLERVDVSNVQTRVMDALP
ncbi:MAG: protein phosphatase 2C domain-containing protein [Aggregatilineales bacterium]